MDPIINSGMESIRPSRSATRYLLLESFCDSGIRCVSINPVILLIFVPPRFSGLYLFQNREMLPVDRDIFVQNPARQVGIHHRAVDDKRL